MKLANVACCSAAAAAVFLAAAPAAFAQSVRAEDADLWDVIETSDGNTWKGVIVEQVPGKYYKIQLVGGTLVTVEAKKVKKMTKEANPQKAAPPTPAPAPPPVAEQPPVNPGYPPPEPAPTPAPAAPAAASGLPAPMARSGVRLGLGAGLLNNQGDFGDISDGGFVLAARGGYEVLKGNFGISGGVRLAYSRFDKITFAGIEFNLSSIQVQAEGRAALHAGRFVPYLGLALGYEQFIDDEDLPNPATGGALDPSGGFALTITIGLDVMITPSVAAGLYFALDPSAAAPYEIDGFEVPKAKRNTLGLGLTFLL